MTLLLSSAPAGAPETEAIAAAAAATAHPIWLRGQDGAERWRNDACDRFGLDLTDARLRAAWATAAATDADQSLRVTGADNHILTATESPGGLGFATFLSKDSEADGDDGPARDIGAACAAIDQISACVAVFGAGRRLMYANAAFAGFWRLPEGFLSDGPRIEYLLDRMRESGRLPAVANYALWRDEISGWADPLAEAPAEDDWHLANGNAVRLERRVDDAARTILSFRDVSAEIALERRSRRIVSIQRKTLHALNGGVAMFDPDGRLRLVNPAYVEFWTLRPAQASVGVHIGSIPAPETDGPAAEAWRALRRAVTSGSPDTTERRFRLGGRVLQAAAAPMPDGSTLARIDDCTAAQQAETALRERGEALAAAAELRAALADCASVKLRTALTSISGFAELMTLDCLDPERRQQSQAILAATVDMAKSIAELEQLAASPEAEGGDPLRASSLLATTADLLSRALWTAEARLEQVDESDGAAFPGDAESLRQIAQAMSLAALDDLPPGCTLRLAARRAEPDGADGVAATLIAQTDGPVDRPPPTERLIRALALAHRIGATLAVRDEGGLRTITLTGAVL